MVSNHILYLFPIKKHGISFFSATFSSLLLGFQNVFYSLLAILTIYRYCYVLHSHLEEISSVVSLATNIKIATLYLKKKYIHTHTFETKNSLSNFIDFLLFQIYYWLSIPLKIYLNYWIACYDLKWNLKKKQNKKNCGKDYKRWKI